MPCSAEADAQVREALGELKLLGATLASTPEDSERVSAQLQATIDRLAVVRSAPDAALVAELRSELQRVHALFDQATDFYRGWSSLAAVSERDVQAPSLSVKG